MKITKRFPGFDPQPEQAIKMYVSGYFFKLSSLFSLMDYSIVQKLLNLLFFTKLLTFHDHNYNLGNCALRNIEKVFLNFPFIGKIPLFKKFV